MTPADYHDWWSHSGICPGDPTRPANYADLLTNLSAPGVNLIILWELLKTNAEFSDTTYITPHGIYGARERIVAAARDVGATRIADYLATLPDSGVEPESHRELKMLLKQYAARYKAELTADMARHGDPRAEPDFDKRQSRRKRDERWVENNRRYQISDRVPFFVEPLKKLRELLANGLTLSQASMESEVIAQLAASFQYDFPRWSNEPQPPDVSLFLEECRQLADRYPQQLTSWSSGPPTAPIPTPRIAEVSADQNTLNLLRAIGPYKTEEIGEVSIIEWESVSALDNSLAPMGLRFTYEGDFPRSWISAWVDAQKRFRVALPALTRELLALAAQQVTDDELRGDDEELLSQVDRGMLMISVESDHPTGYRVECGWDGSWDPEHSFVFEISESGELLRKE